MGYLRHIRAAWRNPSPEMTALQRQRLIQWRQEPVTVRLQHPTRPDRAHALGYRAKQGFFIVRQQVSSGSHIRPKKIMGGRKPKQARRRMVLAKSYQWIAEERAANKYVNCEVLNSYFAGKDGQSYWYEIILVDRHHPVVMHDPHIRWIHKNVHRGRVFRGLTAAGKRTRGILTHKGKGAEKLR